MKKLPWLSLYVVFSLLCLGWTWLAGAVLVGAWISIPYGLLTVVLLAETVQLCRTKEKRHRRAILGLLLIPLAVGVGIAVFELGKLLVGFVMTLLHLILQH